jgi:hypothetical protein
VSPARAVAVVFVWLGMVLAISFLEAPRKFRAPNVTLQIGLGVGGAGLGRGRNSSTIQLRNFRRVPGRPKD